MLFANLDSLTTEYKSLWRTQQPCKFVYTCNILEQYSIEASKYRVYSNSGSLSVHRNNPRFSENWSIHVNPLTEVNNNYDKESLRVYDKTGLVLAQWVSRPAGVGHCKRCYDWPLAARVVFGYCYFGHVYSYQGQVLCTKGLQLVTEFIWITHEWDYGHVECFQGPKSIFS